jgi:hypothetical protein
VLKLLFLDTCAVVKIFVPEPGHDIMQWLLESEAILQYSAHLVTSKSVCDEFPNTIRKMVRSGQISEPQSGRILASSRGYFVPEFGGLDIVDMGPPPGFRSGSDASEDTLVRKYNLKDRDRTDCAQLAAIVNYLRCFGAGSLPHVVTADKDFSRVIRAEGFGVINPEKYTVLELKGYLSSLDFI